MAVTIAKFVVRNHRSLLSSSSCCVIQKKLLATKKLQTVGKLETPKLHGKYGTGQLFLHRVFGYRGILLFPWLARLYDRDIVGNKQDRYCECLLPLSSLANLIAVYASPMCLLTLGSQEADTLMTLPRPAETESEHIHASNKEVKGKTHVYYQVLIDSRDCPFIRAQTESVTFLGNQENNRSLYAIPGLDYVAHEDVLPYSTTENQPLQHELFDKFLEHTPGQDPPFTPKDTLRAWQEKNHPWLELSDVHKETTEDIRVTVIPFYMGARISQDSSVYWWRYCIRLENLGDETVQLRERHWRIFSLSGTLETVRGRGVVGQEPILSKEQPAFQYSSHVSLQAPSGHMWGTFRMERSDGFTFDCRIPPFTLESKSDDQSSPHGFFG